MRERFMLGAFIVVALVQAGIPLSMISRREATLAKGAQYRFRTAPVDPYDAFRGRYVALRMNTMSVPAGDLKNVQRRQRVFVTLSTDAEGFATLEKASRERPREGDYLVFHVLYPSNSRLRLKNPFDRYYMNEKDAPEAERVYNRLSGGRERDAYITVRVRSGMGVLEELYVGGLPILEFMAKEAAAQKGE